MNNIAFMAAKKQSTHPTVRARETTAKLLYRIAKESGEPMADILGRMIPDAKLEMELERVLREKAAAIEEQLRNLPGSRKK